MSHAIDTKLDGFAVIREQVEKMQPGAATERLLELLRLEKLSYYEMGALLRRHKQKKLYKGPSFRSFIEVELREDYDRMNRSFASGRQWSRQG